MTLIVRPDYHAVPILEKNGIRWIPPSQAMRQDGLNPEGSYCQCVTDVTSRITSIYTITVYQLI
jgi:hypothetical protein